jgi:hypothetical protein
MLKLTIKIVCDYLYKEKAAKISILLEKVDTFHKVTN